MHIYTIVFGLLELLWLEETFVKVPALKQRVPGLSLSQYNIYFVSGIFAQDNIFQVQCIIV